MDLDEMIKYIIWSVVFIIALIGIYTMLKKLGVN
jgi:uncharacterized membrane protein